jgi:hypothetical protein
MFRSKMEDGRWKMEDGRWKMERVSQCVIFEVARINAGLQV